MLGPAIYCYCDFSVSHGVVSEQVEDLLQEISNHFGFREKFVRHISFEDQGWTGNILRVLEGLSDNDYIFIWFDDLLIDGEELTKAISLGLKKIKQYSYVRITGRPIPKGKDVGEGFRYISLNESYQSSLVGSFWSISYLKKLIDPGDTPWKIELKKHNSSAIGSVNRLPIKNTKIKGKDNIFHHPQPKYSLENILVSISWGMKRLVREALCRFPRVYHWLYSK